MLTAATVGMAAYGLYDSAMALAGVFGMARLEVWAHALQFALGLLLMLAAPFVRVNVPGGLPLATGAILGLQALALHAVSHLQPDSIFAYQITRAAVGGALLLLGLLGNRKASPVRQ